MWRAPEGPEGLAAVPVGGGRAWPGFEATRRAEGSQRGRLAGGPPPTGTPSSPAPRPGHLAPGTAVGDERADRVPRGCGREKSGRQSGRGSVTERVEIE